MRTFGRLITAMVTPFSSDGAVDYGRARELAQALVASGTDDLVVTGTTGEAPTLTRDEKLRLYREVKAAIGDRAGVIAGTCSNNTAESIALSREAIDVGADGILGTVPWYNKPPQAGLELHFRAIAEAVDAPIILYNVPSRTVTNLLPDTAIRLSEVPNIVGIKEASGNLEAVGKIIREGEPGFRVWSGNDADTLPILAIGGYGVVSTASHLVGRQIARMMECAVTGQAAEAAEIHARLLPLFTTQFITTGPIPLKYALSQVGFSCGSLRLPLVDIDPKSAEAMDVVLRDVRIDLQTTISV